MWNSTLLRWTSTLFDICMCLYNVFTRYNNAISETRWRCKMRVRSRVISQALACQVYSSTLPATYIYLPLLRSYLSACLLTHQLISSQPMNFHASHNAIIIIILNHIPSISIILIVLGTRTMQMQIMLTISLALLPPF